MPEKKLKLKSMDKIQLLNIMRQQELEIKRLTAERDELANRSDEKEEKEKRIVTAQNIQVETINTASSLEDSCMLASGIIQSAQAAADLYLKNIKLLEAEKSADTVGQKVDEIKGNEEIGHNEKATLTDLRIVAYLYMNFINQSHSVLHEMIERYNLTELLEIDKPKQIAEIPEQINEITEISEVSEVSEVSEIT